MLYHQASEFVASGAYKGTHHSDAEGRVSVLRGIVQTRFFPSAVVGVTGSGSDSLYEGRVKEAKEGFSDLFCERSGIGRCKGCFADLYTLEWGGVRF